MNSRPVRVRVQLSRGPFRRNVEVAKHILKRRLRLLWLRYRTLLPALVIVLTVILTLRQQLNQSLPRSKLPRRPKPLTAVCMVGNGGLRGRDMSSKILSLLWAHPGRKPSPTLPPNASISQVAEEWASPPNPIASPNNVDVFDIRGPRTAASRLLPMTEFSPHLRDGGSQSNSDDLQRVALDESGEDVGPNVDDALDADNNWKDSLRTMGIGSQPATDHVVPAPKMCGLSNASATYPTRLLELRTCLSEVSENEKRRPSAGRYEWVILVRADTFFIESLEQNEMGWRLDTVYHNVAPKRGGRSVLHRWWKRMFGLRSSSNGFDDRLLVMSRAVAEVLGRGHQALALCELYVEGRRRSGLELMRYWLLKNYLWYRLLPVPWIGLRKDIGLECSKIINYEANLLYIAELVKKCEALRKRFKLIDNDNFF